MSAPLQTPVFPAACVVDASVLIKRFLPEAGSDLAIVLLGPPDGDPAVARVVPDLLFIECANVLWRHVRRGGLAPDVARAHLADLLALALTVFPAQDLLPVALELALTHGITAYDAAYLALADALAVPLVTADELLARAVGDPGRVRLLADYAGP